MSGAQQSSHTQNSVRRQNDYETYQDEFSKEMGYGEPSSHASYNEFLPLETRNQFLKLDSSSSQYLTRIEEQENHQDVLDNSLLSNEELPKNIQRPTERLVPTTDEHQHRETASNLPLGWNWAMWWTYEGISGELTGPCAGLMRKHKAHILSSVMRRASCSAGTLSH